MTAPHITMLQALNTVIPLAAPRTIGIPLGMPVPQSEPSPARSARATLTTENACVLWSRKHEKWWRAHAAGYTSDLNHAGVYSESEALTQAELSANAIEAQRTVVIKLSDALMRDPNVEAVRLDTVAWLLTSERPAPSFNPERFYNHSLEVHL